MFSPRPFLVSLFCSHSGGRKSDLFANKNIWHVNLEGFLPGFTEEPVAPVKQKIIFIKSAKELFSRKKSVYAVTGLSISEIWGRNSAPFPKPKCMFFSQFQMKNSQSGKVYLVQENIRCSN